MGPASRRQWSRCRRRSFAVRLHRPFPFLYLTFQVLLIVLYAFSNISPGTDIQDYTADIRLVCNHRRIQFDRYREPEPFGGFLRFCGRFGTGYFPQF